MTIYKNDLSKQIILFNNETPQNLPIDAMVTEALGCLGFKILKEDFKDMRLKLVMWHGSIPQQAQDTQFNYPVTCLKMSSVGFFGTRPNISFQRIKDVYEPNYFVQGSHNSVRMPCTQEEWVRLISWLLSIAEKKWNENDEAPLPDVPETRKFIYTEPYPDALVACYLAMVADKPALLEKLKKEAEEDYKQLRAKHGLVEEAFDQKGIKALFTKMATI